MAKSVEERKKFVGPDGRMYVRDGSVAFPLDDVMAANGDFNALDPNTAISYVGTMSKQKRLKDNEYRDRVWNQAARELGHTGDWRQLRRQMLANAKAKGVPDSELEYLWGAGPINWKEQGYLDQPATPPPTGTNRVPPQAGLTPGIINTPYSPGQVLPQPPPVNPLGTDPFVAGTNRPGAVPGAVPTTRPPVPAPNPYVQAPIYGAADIVKQQPGINPLGTGPTGPPTQQPQNKYMPQNPTTPSSVCWAAWWISGSTGSKKTAATNR